MLFGADVCFALQASRLNLGLANAMDANSLLVGRPFSTPNPLRGSNSDLAQYSNTPALHHSARPDSRTRTTTSTSTNAERRTPNAKRQTRSAKREAPGEGELVGQHTQG